jgi:DnaK suppressor protein
MSPERLEHFRQLLMTQLAEHKGHIRDERAAALDFSDDGVMDTPDLSLVDVNKELAFKLGERESEMVADIDQALLRIREGVYGQCVRCGKPIDERRLEAVPTARYDAECQQLLERVRGEETPSL